MQYCSALIPITTQYDFEHRLWPLGLQIKNIKFWFHFHLCLLFNPDIEISFKVRNITELKPHHIPIDVHHCDITSLCMSVFMYV